jgi:hypothetical protein
VPCPVCGYDLRARVSRRCSECGTEIREAFITSRIPWVHRRYRGTVRAFLATMWMTLWRPGELARELEWRVNRREAKKFHRVALGIGTIISTAMLMGAFALRGNHWKETLSLEMPWNYDTGRIAFNFPALVLTDSYWCVLPLLLASYLGLAMSMWVYRGLVGWTGSRRHRMHVRRLAMYASSQAVLQALVLGSLSVAGMILYEELNWNEYVIMALWPAVWVLLALSITAFYIPALFFIWKTGPRKWVRALCLLVLFPPAAPLAAMISWWVVFWTTGYVVLGVRSMLAP